MIYNWLLRAQLGAVTSANFQGWKAGYGTSPGNFLPPQKDLWMSEYPEGEELPD